MTKIKLQKNDKVLVISGKDKGKTGRIERVITKKREVIVSKINIVKRHIKPSQHRSVSGVVESESPLAISKVALICPSCGKPTRVGYQKKNNEKNRICKRCKKVIEKTKEEPDKK
ncbi:MAG: 50S ribosomal protein L24 [Patescibacteria group bacterium]|nr:50S ribosomal protein L24 [Patescibacteria group bacterium]